MKKLIPFLISAVTFILIACNKSKDVAMDEPISYPVTFTYNNLELGDSHFYIVQNQAVEAIEATGSFTQFETFLAGDLTLENLDFPFGEFILLNETEIQMQVINQGGAPYDTTLNYTQIDNNIRILFDETNDIFLDLEYDTAENRLKYCIFSTAYTYVFNNQPSSIVEIDQCLPLDPPSLAMKILEDNSLESGDTIAINNSNFIFD